MDRVEVRALFDSEACSIAKTVELIGDRWSMLILREAFYGISRFEDIRSNIGVSRAVLTDRLDSLVGSGLLERIPYQLPGHRARHEYRLTEAGAELVPAFVALLQWGDKHRNAGRAPITLTHAGCGGTIHAVLHCDHGHAVTPEAIEPEPGPGVRASLAARRKKRSAAASSG